ncbi:hypothetical protein [Dactylosporangium sp. NPDC051541]|uniref:hypothetical protein n=1 Tax=Dactylosporangium sp. NPDC051541 TaxID=3363977 RepID=UPI0037AD8231
MSIKRQLLTLAASTAAAGAVLAGPATPAHAGTVRTVNSSATICVNDPGLSLSRCFSYGWSEQLAPGQFNEHDLPTPKVGRYDGKFTVRVGVSDKPLGYGQAYATATGRRLTLSTSSSSQTVNTKVTGNSKFAIYFVPGSGSFTDSAQDDLNLGAPYPGSMTLTYNGTAF